MASEDQTQALSTLYQAEVGANVGELQATTAIVLGLLAYLAATIFLVNSISAWLSPLLPLGVLFASAYQMLRVAVVTRRAALARMYERRLVETAGFTTESFDSGRVGSLFYGQLDDPRIIREKKPAGWRVRALVAVIAYAGLYAIAIVYTAVILKHMWAGGAKGLYGTVWIVVYVVLWAGLLLAAFRLFAKSEPTDPYLT